MPKTRIGVATPSVAHPSVSAPSYSNSDIENMEKLTLEKANKALSAIENALAVWNASKEKPEALEIRVRRLRAFYDELSSWEKKMLKSMAKKENVDTRINNLREFSDICHAYT